MSGITVTRVGERLLAVKRASPGDHERRRQEAALLERLDHPGVVQFVELVDEPEIELRLDYAGTDTWSRTPPTTGAAIVEGLAALASTVADLHEMGTAHRALTPDHVIVGPDRRPVLCGLADAAPADAATKAEDLEALADLIDTVAAGAPHDLRSGLTGAATAARQNGLSARRLTAELNRLRPGGNVRALVHRPRVTPRTAAGLAVAAVALGVLAVAVWPSGAAPPPDATPPTVDTVPPTTSLVDVTTTSAAPAAEPTVLVHDGRRFALGSADDQVVMGDWDCDGEPTPAVLVRATGEIARFASWPAPGGSVFADDLISDADAIALEVVADASVDGGTCDRLRIIRSAGSSFFPEDS